MVPPSNAASTPLVGAHCEGVVVLVCEAEHLLAAVAEPVLDDLPHLVGAGIAAIDDVLKWDARRNDWRPGEGTGLSRAKVKDAGGRLVVRSDLTAETEDRPIQVATNYVERGRIKSGYLDANALREWRQ